MQIVIMEIAHIHYKLLTPPLSTLRRRMEMEMEMTLSIGIPNSDPVSKYISNRLILLSERASVLVPLVRFSSSFYLHLFLSICICERPKIYCFIV